MSKPQTIAVDLVPMLPGGANGGAKIFVLELLRTLPRIVPEIEFVLFTQKSSHHELDSLVGPKMRRQMVWDDKAASGGRRPWPARLARSFTRRVPTAFWRSLPPALIQFCRGLIAPSDPSSVLARSGADLLYCPFGGTVFAECRIPAVVTVYDLQYRAYPEFFDPQERAQRDRNFRRAASMSVMAVISNFVRDSVIATGLVDPDQVFSIPIKLPRRLHNIDSRLQTRALEKHGVEAKKYFIYPANFWRHKNHDALISAFYRARSTGLASDVKLVLTGAPSPRLQEVIAHARSLGIGHLVRAPGFVDEDELSALIRMALATINPSLYEGFGMPVLEAMAADCPVACSNVTSLPEVAGDAALLFDPTKPEQIAAAMVRIATDEALRNDLVAKGRARVDFYSDTADMARQYWRLFELAMDGKIRNHSVAGLYPDGWAGPQILLRYAAGSAQRSLHFVLQVPEMLPFAHLNLGVRDADGRVVGRFRIARGHQQEIDVAVGEQQGMMVISISPHFRPSHFSQSTDSRDLTLQVRSIELCGSDGAHVILSPAA